MNPYKNTLQKVKALLKEDDHLTTGQCEVYQWQLLLKVLDFTFFVGKGGINTIFYSLSSTERATCYPDELLTMLEKMAKSDVFVYVALNKKKKMLDYSVDRSFVENIKDAAFIATVSHKGKKKIVLRKTKDLLGKTSWQEK